VSNTGNPDRAGRKAFIKVYEDALVGIFDSGAVFEAAAQEFKKAYAAAGGKDPAVPTPGSATRRRHEVLEVFRNQARIELAAFPEYP
jgi:hypothetical protein